MKTAREIIFRSCIDKSSLSKADAENAIDHYAKQNKVMYYYRCDFCNRFHISKQSETAKTLQIIGGKSAEHRDSV